MIEVEQLVVHYGEREALRGLDFAVNDGEFFGLLGPNGAGKTTAISALCGLVEPTRGTIRIGGQDARRERRRVRRGIGLVPQHLAFYGALSARQNLAFFGRLHGHWGADLQRRVQRALAFAQLEDRADQRVSTYSGGMKRRLNVAIGLLHDPSLLILDEPTVGVDAQSRNAMLTSLQEIARGGTTILFTTHLMEEARRICDRIAILDQGRIVATGTPAELIERHGSALLRLRIEPQPPDAFVRWLGAEPGVGEITCRGARLDVVVVGEGTRLVARVAERATRDGLDVRQLDFLEPDLENVFLALTGRELRD